jgi:hypothetical protein
MRLPMRAGITWACLGLGLAFAARASAQSQTPSAVHSPWAAPKAGLIDSPSHSTFSMVVRPYLVAITMVSGVGNAWVVTPLKPAAFVMVCKSASV